MNERAMSDESESFVSSIHPTVHHNALTTSPLIVARSCSTSNIAASLASCTLISNCEFRSFSFTTSSASRARPAAVSDKISAMPSATAPRCRRSLALCPVKILSMSICPVFGSHAACCIAARISRSASVESRFSTTFDSRILARLSARRMLLSNCLGVAVITFRPPPTPSRRMSTYPSTRYSAASSESTGWYLDRAYEMYSVSVAASNAPVTFSGGFSKCRLMRCAASRLSVSTFGLSSTRKIRSNRDRSVGGRSMFSTTDMFGLYRDPIGFADASTEVRAFNTAMIPALAMDTRRPRALGHLIELVDAAYPAVTQHERAGLEHEVFRLWIPRDVRGETDGGGASAGGVDSTRRNLVHVRQQLRLRYPRVANEDDVDVASDARPRGRARQRLVRRAEELAQEPFLHLLHLPDGRRERRDESLVDVLPLTDLLERRDSLRGELRLRVRALGAVRSQPAEIVGVVVVPSIPRDGDAVALVPRPVLLVFPRRGVFYPRRRVLAYVYHVQVRLVHRLQDPLRRRDAYRHGSVHARDLHAIPWLGLVDEGVEDAHGHRVRGLALGDRVRGLLHLDLLLVREYAPVVDQRRGPERVAAGAFHRGLVHAPAVDVRHLRGGRAARRALEKRHL
eukprot:30845-Pelagococcus_subviridis.AAC.14